jgi:hypothetical protein
MVMKIHTDHQLYRKKPYVARWYEAAPDSAKATPGKLRQRNRFFASAAARDEFIAQFKQTAQRQDPVLPALAPHQLMRLQQAVAIAPEADPVEVFKFWARAQREKLKIEERRLKDAAAGYVQSMERVGRDASYIGHVRRALADLQDELGNKLVRDIASTELADHLFGLPYSGVTLKNRRTYLLGAFGWWEQQGWVNQNAMKKVESPQVHDKEPEILTVAETRQLFRANEKIDPEICGLLALGAFAGMRSSAISPDRLRGDRFQTGRDPHPGREDQEKAPPVD